MERDEGDGRDTCQFDDLPALDHPMSLEPICISMVVHSCGEQVVSND